MQIKDIGYRDKVQISRRQESERSPSLLEKAVGPLIISSLLITATLTYRNGVIINYLSNYFTK